MVGRSNWRSNQFSIIINYSFLSHFFYYNYKQFVPATIFHLGHGYQAAATG